MFEDTEMSIKKEWKQFSKKKREIQAKYDMEMENMMGRLEKEKKKIR